MDDKVAPTKEPETKTEEKPEDAKPVIDSQKPLSRQVDKLLEQLPEEKEEKDVKPDESKEEDKEEVPEKPEEKKEDESTEEEKSPAEDNEEAELPEPDDTPPVELPSWQKYVLDNLPEIQTIGHTKDGKDRLFKVKRAEDLPDNFEFASKRDELTFNAAIASQEVNARELLNKYQQEEQNQKFQEFQNQEAIDVQSDIQKLQKEGLLDKFKYSEDDPEFNSDPAVKVANEIYDIYKKTNDAYLKEFQKTGRNYRISYRDAADKYFAMQGRKTETKDKAKQERTKVAEKVSAPQSAPPESGKRGMPAGATMQDILKMYKLGKI